MVSKAAAADSERVRRERVLNGIMAVSFIGWLVWVWVGGKPAALGARAFDLLLALYERRDRVVPKNELLDLVWPGLVVEENNLQVQVSSLRKVLGPAAIATIPGRGYRFTSPGEALARGRAATSTKAAAAADAVENADVLADDALRGNLPASPPMVGRDVDLAAVAALLQRHPVVSIVGAGGIGKTRLALAVAHACALATPEGRWWVELAPLADAAQAPSTIAGALGLQLAGGRPPAEALVAMLARHRALIVLDNCEHVADARVPMLGVHGLLARLDRMFNVLTGASRMRLRRHQTLRAALEWSCGLLTEDERAVFRRLGVFSGGFTLALAQGVAADERIDGWQVLDLLSQLIEKSLVLAEGEGEPRYRLLEPTRCCALARSELLAATCRRRMPRSPRPRR